MTCPDALRAVARRVDGQMSSDEDDARLDVHLEACRGCREALAEQRAVASVVRARPAERVSSAFNVRLAARLDALEARDAGWIGMADWRRWTFRLAPLAAGLALVSYLTSPPQEALPLDDWTAAGTTEAALLRDAGVTSEAVLDAMLTGGAATDGGGDVR